MSERRRLLLLFAFALLLGAALALDWMKQGPQQSKPAGQAGLSAITTGNPLAGRNRTDLSSLYEHPLFDPARQSLLPPPEPENPSVVALSGETAPAPPILHGTVLGPDISGAYLEWNSAPAVFLKPGEQLGDFTLRSVGRDGVILEGPAGSVTLPAPALPAP